nr:hypothetical protein CFP56_04741 [Quercus suber]
MPSQKNPATPTSNIDEQANSGADEPRRQAPMNQTPTNPGTDFTRPRRTQQHRRRSTKNKLQAPILTKPRRKLIGSNKWRRTRSEKLKKNRERRRKGEEEEAEAGEDTAIDQMEVAGDMEVIGDVVKRNGGTTTRRRAESGSIGGRVHSVEEELAVPLRFDHIPPYRMAVSHCPMGPTTAHPHLGFIFRRSKTRLRDPHFLGRP